MRVCQAILLSGLSLWIEPASAAEITVHPLTVSIHEAVRSEIEAGCYQHLHKDLEGCIKQILKDASDNLQEGSDTQAACAVGFSLKGPIATFTSAPADITDARTLEAVHRVPADVKIVRSIHYCVGETNGIGYWGCSWRARGLRKTVIVARPRWLGIDPVIWAHEYGHTTGLLHFADKQNENLMTPCPLEPFNKVVTKNQCRHLVAGPVRHPPPGQGDQCKTNSFTPSRND